MKLAKQCFLGVVFTISTLIGFAQEQPPKESVPVEMVPAEVKMEEPKRGGEQVVGEFEAVPKESKKTKKEKKKKEPKGPFLVAMNAKQKKTRKFEIGEKLKYQAKTDKKASKGILEEIDGEYVKIDGKRVKVKNLIYAKKKFGRTIGDRLPGFRDFGIGTGIAAVGGIVIAYSAQQVDLNSTKVVWGVFGGAIGTGISLVGLHLMVRGGKTIFQSSRYKTEKGWKFSIE